MYRCVRLSGHWFALEIDEIDDDIENIETFVSEGSPVVLCDQLEDLAELVEIITEDITLSEPED